MSTRSRRRTRALLGCAIILGVFWLPRDTGSTTALAAASILEPAQRLLARSGRTLGRAVAGLGSWGAEAENRRLEKKVAELTEQVARERARSIDLDRRLHATAEFVRHQKDLGSAQVRVVAEAEVIGEGAGPQSGTVFIDRGTNHGVVPGTVVVEGRSVVGIVRAASGSVSSVLLVTSVGSRLTGRIVPTGKFTEAGELGIVVGNGDGTMRVKYISKRAPEVGDFVVTRGQAGRIPKHLLIGEVVEATRSAGQRTYDVLVRPARDIDRLVTVVAVRPNVPTPDLNEAAAPEADTDE